MRRREALAWAMAFVLTGLLYFQHQHYAEEQYEDAETLYQCAEALLVREEENADLRYDCADVYYERGDVLYEVTTDVCAQSGWVQPIDWYASMYEGE